MNESILVFFQTQDERLLHPPPYLMRVYGDSLWNANLVLPFEGVTAKYHDEQ